MSKEQLAAKQTQINLTRIGELSVPGGSVDRFILGNKATELS